VSLRSGFDYNIAGHSRGGKNVLPARHDVVIGPLGDASKEKQKKW
jgi:hypothetical protein